MEGLMKKRILSLVLVLILVLSILPSAAFAAGSLSNFAKQRTYHTGQFADVSDQWFAPYVQACFEFGLFEGIGANTFSPNKNISVAETLKLASCLHSIFNTGSATFPKNPNLWYQPYVDYALSNGIIPSPYTDYTVNATRSDMAVIFTNALPDEALTVINTIDNDAIPDVSLGYSYGPAVYKLYRAGVLTGSDSIGTYYPNNDITRDAVAAIVARMAIAGLRQKLTFTGKALSKIEIASKCAPAVFYIELMSKTGKAIGSGCGFFISCNGLAVTNYHVIKGITSAKIKTKDGQHYDVTGIYDYDEASDLALIQISGSGFPYLEIGDSNTAVTGGDIYALGYPLGIDLVVTPGTITNASHAEDGVNYIMIDASISHGSSGGALVDSNGKVIGVTSVYYSGGQNLNLAVPINLLKDLSSTETLRTLPELFTRNITYYGIYPTIPDFGAFSGISVDDQRYSLEYSAQYYVYPTTGVEQDIYGILDAYLTQLALEGFDYLGYADVNGDAVHALIDSSGSWEIGVGIMTVGGEDYVMVMILPATS